MLTVSYERFMCKMPLLSQLKVIQHINNCNPVYAMYLGFDDPSLVSDLSCIPAVDTVFSFNDKDRVVSKTVDFCQQALTRRYISNSSYFDEDNISGDILVAKWE